MQGICSAGGITARHAARKFGFRYATTRESEILDDDSTDAVIIATRHDLHARQVITALEAGKNVYVEKPLALNEAELVEIHRVWRECQKQRQQALILMVGYNRRFAAMTRRLKAELANLNEPMLLNYRINAGYITPDHWVHDPEQGGGRIVGEVCHFVDLLTHLAGALPTRIAAGKLANLARYKDDNIVATLWFADGSVGTITYAANGDRKLPKERIEISCGGTSAVLDNFRRLQVFRSGKGVDKRDRFSQDKGHQAALEAFRDAIVGGVMPIPMQELMTASRVPLAIARAAQSGEVVHLEPLENSV
jgi:predicted dehydrogenase